MSKNIIPYIILTLVAQITIIICLIIAINTVQAEAQTTGAISSGVIEYK